MSPKALLRRAKRRPLTRALAVALAAGVIVHILGLAAVGATWKFPAPPPAPQTYVSAVNTDSALNERAALLDPSPLFLPTPGGEEVKPALPMLNADQPPLGPPARQIALTEALIQGFVKESATPTVTGKSLEELVARGKQDKFLTIGREKPDTRALTNAATTFIVRDEATGAPVTTRKTDLRIPSGDDSALLGPAEFFVEVDSYGVNAPLLKKTSGDTETDKKYAKAILDNLLTTPPGQGRFLIVVAP